MLWVAVSLKNRVFTFMIVAIRSITKCVLEGRQSTSFCIMPGLTLLRVTHLQSSGLMPTHPPGPSNGTPWNLNPEVFS
ncbi:hypothetical protein CABS01_15176 [Colletotrichum abscissum]|uniref:uncharacterized protein n=1 Tax=Colletotrichum abscissum TaxID=1671311 RepID=UPI0027D7699A|nr:uncharacterized protein CABS01_15176 [Colletotrichum abscissum]KAK1476892.1 hypothetical protein CABS01_15176 [Colletotrichum abscissum]